MTGYLTRLAMPGRTSAGAQSLQPFIRSTSPIAEYDQRLGASAGGSFEFDGLTPASSEPGGGIGQGENVQPLTSPGITVADSGAAMTLQRKALGSPATVVGVTAPAVSRVPPAETARPHKNGQPPITGTNVGRTRQPPHAFDVTSRGRPLDPAAQSGFDRPPSDVVPVGRKRTPAPFPAEADPVSGGDSIPETPGLNEPWLESATVYPDEESVRVKTDQTPPGTASLRPGPRDHTHLRHVDPLPEDSHTTQARPDDGPHVMIGRINVEVVPPPAAEQKPPPSPAGPLTAASASVIGPLGGHPRPNLRLSLRHR